MECVRHLLDAKCLDGIRFGTRSSRTLTSFRIICALRVMHSLRTVRLLHMSPELHIVLLSLLGCMVPQFWVLVHLFVLVFHARTERISEFVAGD